MDKKLHIKILEFLNDQEDILKYANIKDVIASHYISLYGGTAITGHILSSEISTVIYDLKNRGFINLDNSPSIKVKDSSILSHESFEGSNVGCLITLDGVKYLQSEQDAQVTREFIYAQKEFIIEQSTQIKKQTVIIKHQRNILIGALAVSIISLFISSMSLFQSPNDGIETQLKELVKTQQEAITLEKEKLKSLTNQPVQTLTPKPSKTSSKK